MLKSPLFTGFAGDGKEHMKGNVQADDWRRWIPLIALFTGARIGELAQLRVGDIRQEHGTWIIYIAHDEKEGLATKSKLSRPMAVHPKLIELGFLDFHKREAEHAGGNEKARLFPDMEANNRDQIGAKPSRFWRDYLKRIGLKGDADGLGSHSFRHTIADELRSAGFLDEHVAIALGHKFKSVTSGYGKLQQGTVQMQREMIEKVAFAGVDFSHLTPAGVSKA